MVLVHIDDFLFLHFKTRRGNPSLLLIKTVSARQGPCTSQVFSYKFWEPVGGGFIINGAYPVYLFILPKKIMVSFTSNRLSSR